MKLAIINGNILDGTLNMEVQKDKIILIEDHKIKDIVNKDFDLSEYEVIDAKNQFVLPGLINLHVHLPSGGKPSFNKGGNPAKLVKFLLANKICHPIIRALTYSNAKIQVLSGTTTIRTVGGVGDFDGQVRDLIASGKKVGPRIISSNSAISVPDGHMVGSVAYCANSLEEAKKLANEILDGGADWLKLMITGGVLDSDVKGGAGQMRMPLEYIEECCKIAHAKGKRVAAHVESQEGVKAALKYGVDTIEHGAKLDEECIQLFKEKGATLVTTISPAIPFLNLTEEETGFNEVQLYNGVYVCEGIIEGSKTALANGIRVGLGCDTGCSFVLHYDTWREALYFHERVGVSNKFALHTITLKNAEILGIDNITGSIEVGKDADIIIAKKNPLEDLQALKDLDLVIARGNIIKGKYKRNKEADEALEKIILHN